MIGRVPTQDAGLAGRAFGSQNKVNVHDAYTESTFDQRIDKSSGYRTTSVLVIPVTLEAGIASSTTPLIVDNASVGSVVARQGERLGVLQLINRLDEDGEKDVADDDEGDMTMKVDDMFREVQFSEFDVRANMCVGPDVLWRLFHFAADGYGEEEERIFNIVGP